MKKLFLLVLLVPIAYASCTQENGVIDMKTIKAKVDQNKHFIELCKAQDQLAMMALNRESSFEGVDMKRFQSDLKNAKNLDEVKAMSKKAGIKGGDKIATLMYQMNKNVKDLIEDMPELKKLDKKQFSEILRFKSTITETDIRRSADNILNPDDK